MRKVERNFMRYFTLIGSIILTMMLSSTSTSQQNVLDICKALEAIKTNSGSRSIIEKPKATLPLTKVNDAASLKAFILNAQEGDVGLLAPGIYDVGHLQIKKSVSLLSTQPNAAIFPRHSWLEILANNVHLQGFLFQDGAAISKTNSRDVSIVVRANGVKIIGNYFYNVGAFSSVPDKTGTTIKLTKANLATISNNTFSLNRGIAIKTDDFSKNLLVEHNNFIDSPSYQGVGEVIQIGDALSTGQAKSPHDDTTNARVRRNYVRGWKLESELFSIKSDGNVISENYIEGSGNSAFVIRMGNKNTIENNVMINNSLFPIRISGEENVIRNNFFEGTGSALFFHNEVFYREHQKNLVNAYWAANRNLITKNVFLGYDHLFGIIDQFHIIRNSPEDNVIEFNSFKTNSPQQFERELKNAKYMSLNGNSVTPIEVPICLKKN